MRPECHALFNVSLGLVVPSALFGCYNGAGATAETATDASSGGAAASDAGGTGGDETGADEAPSLPDGLEPGTIPPSGVRRLSLAEYKRTVFDLFGDDVPEAASQYPAIEATPFDNDFQRTTPSESLITGAESLARKVAQRLAEDPARLAGVLPCAPSGPSDSACMEAFVTDVGRRVLRRPLTADEVAELTEHGLAAAVEADRFEQGIDILVAVLLQHPEFLYRVEIGQEVPDVEGVAKLTGYEIATRLSYLLWGTTPTDELLDMAEAGVFDDPEVDEIGDIARDMLGDEQAGEQLDRFHAMWLGYGTLGGGDPLIEPMREEIRAFVRRVVFEDERPWKNLLTFDQTYVTPDLAEHYGIEPPNGDAGWVSLGEDRAGLLSLGGFLALFPGDEDTDPILRGKLIREQFLCMEIVRPDDINPANMDPVEDAVCKKDILGAHTQGTCAGCHTLMDPIGYGLEQYDVIGAFRTQEPGLDECKLDGNGELDGTPFNGPQELGALMAEYRLFQDCALTQLHRFASGHAEFEPADREFLDVLRENPDVLSGEIGLVSLVVDYVAMPQFGFRRDEAEQ